ncbi:hypothetical protein [Pseudomonas sp.]|uniref:hypothetical protein n=1 Tax=Pseudomonas sp. TaxID=306 RepID=UPI002616D27C|nr:hypothetical protein [Pseudomonas sp.]
MKKNSYGYLLPVIFGGLLIVSLIFTWHHYVYSKTFFKPDLQRSYLIASSVLAIIISLGIFIFKTHLTPNDTAKNIKVIISIPAASFMVCMAILSIPFSLSVYLANGVQSSYTATYNESFGGRRSCAGIEFFEPELNKEIKVCHPNVANYSGQVKVYKISTDNGIVITHTII